MSNVRGILSQPLLNAVTSYVIIVKPWRVCHTMEAHMTMEAHIDSVCKSAYFILFNLRKIRKYLNRKSAESVIHAFVTSRIDYCNSLLIGCSKHCINKLQRVQNAAAHVVTRTKKIFVGGLRH